MDFWPIDNVVYPARSAAYTGTAGTTASWPQPPIGTPPRGVLVWCTTDAYITVGDGVTATTSDTPIPANRPVTIGIPSNGLTFVVSAIQIAAGGTLYARPVGGF